MKKMIILVIGFLLLGMVTSAYACKGSQCKTDGNVMDSNEGNAGDILTYDCRQGNTDVGKWVDPTDIPELKGEKGDTGEQGIQGLQGNTGDNGEDGVKGDMGEQGLQGDRGKRGRKGNTGDNGEDGVKGDMGEQGDRGQIGEDGTQGEKGNIGDTGQKGNNGDKGNIGKTGKQGLQGLQGENGKGLEDRYELIIEARLLDTKNTTWSIYGGRDINNNNNIFGAKCVIKFGKSYEEKRLNKLEKKIDLIIEEQAYNLIEVVPYGDNGLKVKTDF